MPAHLRRSPRHVARTLAILTLALGVSLLVIVLLSERSPDEDAEVAQTTDSSTEPTVLGEQIESTTTLPQAPPASAVGISTTTVDNGESSDDGGSGDGGGGDGGEPAPATTVPTTTSPTIGPPTSITRPPPRTTTTTTEPTTTTTEPTTTSTTAPTEP